MKPLLDLAARRRFGIRPGLDVINALCSRLGDPQHGFKAVHVAGTNGKGAVCAVVDAVLRCRGLSVGRYTSPHLVNLNERFFLDGAPVDDETLESAAEKVLSAARSPAMPGEPTFFETLTAVAFELYAQRKVDCAILECGLGGRLDATNVCEPSLCVITRVGLDHCRWLGGTTEEIAAEKAGIVKAGVPVVLGRNAPEVRAVVEAKAGDVGAPFTYAPDLVPEKEIPADYPLPGAFNRENAVTALAALKILAGRLPSSAATDLPVADSLAWVVWPGRFQTVGRFIVDGAHNPPAAAALAAALGELRTGRKPNLIAGFCADKDVASALSLLAPAVGRGYAVEIKNPRSLSAGATAAKMRAAGIDAVACGSLGEALAAQPEAPPPVAVICGSLFLAGEALVELGAYPWGKPRFDGAETPQV